MKFFRAVVFFLIGFLIGSAIAVVQAKSPDEIYQSSAPSVYKVVVAKVGGRFTAGTGFVVAGVSGRKYLATNNHVCKDSISHPEGVFLSTSKEDTDLTHTYIVGQHPGADLCLLADPTGKPPLTLGEGVSGDKFIMVIGYPNGESLTPVVGAFLGLRPKPSRIDLKDGLTIGPSFGRIKIIQGNSGSPILNSEGQVIAVAFATVEEQGIGYFIPSVELKKFLSRF